MKRMPTTAKLTREQAQVEDDESLGRGPLHRRDNNWLSSQLPSARGALLESRR